MSKMISFKDLIDLEPKPKKVKMDNCIYHYDDTDYFDEFTSLSDDVLMCNMNEKNIEVIEEKKEIEKLPTFINDSTTEYYNREKINEIIDKLNELEKREK